MAPTIVTRTQWGARTPRSTAAMTTWAQRTGVAIHHTAAPTSQTVRQIQDYQMDSNGWPDIGYNWLVDQAGRVYEGRAGGWLAIGAHAAGQNTAWIGVCWIGTSGATEPTAAAKASMRWLVDEARRLAGRNLTVRGHGQVPGQATECPGSRLRAWIADGMPTTAPPAEQPTEQEEETMPLTDEDVDRIAAAVAKRPNPSNDTALGTMVRRCYDRTAALPEIAGLLAGLAGTDVVAAVQTALDGHYEQLLTVLTEDLAEALAGRLGEVPAEQVRAAVREEGQLLLSRARLTVEP